MPHASVPHSNTTTSSSSSTPCTPPYPSSLPSPTTAPPAPPTPLAPPAPPVPPAAPFALSGLTDTKPGNIPLLLRLPDGTSSQLDVPITSTIDDVAATLQRQSPQSSTLYRLSFGNADLPPDAMLQDTTIVDAYSHAGQLLNVIAAGRQDAETKAAALDSACAVVESISNGIRDMEMLCAAAIPPSSSGTTPEDPLTDLHALQLHPDSSLSTAQPPQSPPPPPKMLDSAEFKMLTILSDEPQPPIQAASTPPPTPQQLVRNLSRRLPTLFPPSAAANHPTASPPPSQPSISAIRDARRRHRTSSPRLQQHPHHPQSRSRSPPIPLGDSTNVFPLPHDLDAAHRSEHLHPSPPPPPPPPRPADPTVLCAAGNTTWLEDVMTTWGVGVVRDSGILDHSEQGQQLNQYFHNLQQESPPPQPPGHLHAALDGGDVTHASHPPALPGDSSDDPDGQDHASNDIATEDVRHSIALFDLSDSTSPLQHPPKPGGKGNVHGEGDCADANGEDDEEEQDGDGGAQVDSMPDRPVVNITDINVSAPFSTAHANVSMQLPSSATPASTPPVIPSSSLSPSARPSHSSLPRPYANSTSPSSSSLLPSHASSPSLSNNNSNKHYPTTHQRQATKIAPAPNPPRGHTGPLTPNGLSDSMYPSVLAPSPALLSPQPVVPGPKKRGRKRKNPELSEEERALERKHKNRESAKLSRVRRKVIAAEYEERLNALVGENVMLRKQVEGLNNRLVYLQSLLTVSVRQEPA